MWNLGGKQAGKNKKFTEFVCTSSLDIGEEFRAERLYAALACRGEFLSEERLFKNKAGNNVVTFLIVVLSSLSVPGRGDRHAGGHGPRARAHARWPGRHSLRHPENGDAAGRCSGCPADFSFGHEPESCRQASFVWLARLALDLSLGSESLLVVHFHMKGYPKARACTALLESHMMGFVRV
ncbi:hypothetical protein MTO96_001033 [Rhipicephalus appendiculatus]